MRTKVSAGRSSLPWISGLSRFSSHGCYGSLQMRSWPFYSALRSKLLSLISVQAWNESLTAVGFVIWNHCGCKGIKSTLQTVPSLSSHPSEKLNPKKNLFRAVCFPGSFFLGKDKKKKILLQAVLPFQHCYVTEDPGEEWIWRPKSEYKLSFGGHMSLEMPPVLWSTISPMQNELFFSC